jgi:hypothetical protein
LVLIDNDYYLGCGGSGWRPIQSYLWLSSNNIEGLGHAIMHQPLTSVTILAESAGHLRVDNNHVQAAKNGLTMSLASSDRQVGLI